MSHDLGPDRHRHVRSPLEKKKMKINLEIEDKDEGVMRFLYAAIKSLPEGDHQRFNVTLENGLMKIEIIADANAVGHIGEYVDKDWP